MSLENTTITFGKYKGSNLSNVLKDRTYCRWLLDQEWFENNYVYLYNRINEYDPHIYFFKKEDNEVDSFLTSYKYFNLVDYDLITLQLTDNEKICYNFYIQVINELKEKIILRTLNPELNCFDIKAPVKWLQKFEKESGLKRSVFKDFLYSYDLKNITYIVEEIKREGGISYKGAQSFNIAKKRSENQEQWWEIILKEKYGEDLGTQFKYENCIFDFINISTNTIFECKLGIKDFNEEQHKKYLLILNTYRIIYLIAYDCVINIEKKIMYTTEPSLYLSYQLGIALMKNPNKFDEMLIDFEIIQVEDIKTLFGVN